MQIKRRVHGPYMSASTSFKQRPPPPTTPPAKLLSKVLVPSFKVPPLINSAPPLRADLQSENLDDDKEMDEEVEGRGKLWKASAHIAPPDPRKASQPTSTDEDIESRLP
jgi:hypothetical protein